MKTYRTLFILMLSLLVLSCSGGGGGGGGDDDGGGGVTPNATLDSESGQAIAGMSLAMSQVSESFEETVPIDLFSSSSGAVQSRRGLVSDMLNLVRSQVIQNGDQLHVMGAIEESDTCSNGGTISLDASWDGPQEPSDCSEVEDFEGTLSVNACQMGSVSIDGDASFRIGGDLCTPTSITMSYDEWNMQVDDPDIGYSFPDLTISATNLQFSGDDITRMTMRFNGSVEATYEGEYFSAQFDNYSITVDATNPTRVTFSISGSLRGGCLDGWITIATLEPIVVENYQTCPTAGRLRITGNGEMLITFNADGSVDIGDDHYTSCSEISSECGN